MLFNTSYRNKDYEKKSIEMLGEAYSIFEKIKHRGIGSSRLIIKQISTNLKPKTCSR